MANQGYTRSLPSRSPSPPGGWDTLSNGCDAEDIPFRSEVAAQEAGRLNWTRLDLREPRAGNRLRSSGPQMLENTGES